jgi:urease accessory protein UreE
MIIVNRIELSSEQRGPLATDDRVAIDCFQACRNRLAVKSEAGRQLFIELDKDVYLEDGCCLVCENGQRVLAFRPKEPAFRLGFPDAMDDEKREEMYFAIGHQLGNLHLPSEVVDGDVLGPSVTGRDSIIRVAEAFSGLLNLAFLDTQLGLYRPLFGIRGGHH